MSERVSYQTAAAESHRKLNRRLEALYAWGNANGHPDPVAAEAKRCLDDARDMARSYKAALNSDYPTFDETPREQVLAACDEYDVDVMFWKHLGRVPVPREEKPS